jgi:tetratricopeptide (TPR) repeat protein
MTFLKRRSIKVFTLKKSIVFFCCVLIIGMMMFISCKSTPADDLLSGGNAKKPMVIAGYTFELPSWWNSVQVSVPATLKTENDVRDFVMENYGMDTGTKKTWKQALKTWAIACRRLNIFPVYLAHCYREGGEFELAAGIYADLYPLADNQKQHRDWYRVYLSYNAGELYDQMGDKEKAKLWFSRAAEYAGHSDSSINYYAGVAAKRLKSLEKEQ